MTLDCGVNMYCENDEVYDSLQEHSNYLKQLDVQILAFLKEIDNAPNDVKSLSMNFIRSIDALKKDFINAIVKKKHIEKRYEESNDRFQGARLEYENIEQMQNNYLIQFDDNAYSVAYGRFQKAYAEKMVSESALAVANREFDLCKEGLLRQSKMQELFFHSELKKIDNMKWYHIFTAPQYATSTKLKEQSLYDVSKLENYTVSDDETYLNLDVQHDNEVFQKESESFPPLGYRIGRSLSETQNPTFMRRNYSGNLSGHSRPTGSHHQRCYSETNISIIEKENLYSAPPTNPFPYRKASVPCLSILGRDEPLQYQMNHDMCQSEVQLPHIYEDLYLSQQAINSQGKRTNPKKKGKLFKFLRKQIHGPWEGWDQY